MLLLPELVELKRLESRVLRFVSQELFVFGDFHSPKVEKKLKEAWAFCKSVRY